MKCEFNADHVLEIRRQISADTKLHWSLQASLIRDIDDSRIAHARTYKCDCWDKALEAA